MPTHTLSHFAAALLARAASQARAADAVVTAPGCQLAIRIADDGAGFSITRRGETVIASSPLGLKLDGQPAFGTAFVRWAPSGARWTSALRPATT